MAKNTWLLWDVFRPAKNSLIFLPVWRFATAEDLVARAAEGPERLKTELRLYRQQLEQVGVFFFVCWLMSPERKCDKCSRLKKMVDDLKVVCKTFVSFVDFMRFQMIS